MPFDVHDIGQIGAAGAAGGIAGIITQIYNKFRLDRRLDYMTKEIHQIDEKHDILALTIARDYVTRSEIKEDFKEFKQILKEISAKLDQKADK